MENNTQEKLKELFEQLPKPVQKAITSADVSKQLRELATKEQLHIDQLEALENEVLMALFGLRPIENIEENIKKNVGVSAEAAASIAGDISEIVFSPIREELERELEHPEAKERALSGVEASRTAELEKATQGETAPASALVQPATPPSAPLVEKAVRVPPSGTYKPGEVSTARKNVHEDPYREPPA
jgi:hypothetical protein